MKKWAICQQRGVNKTSKSPQFKLNFALDTTTKVPSIIIKVKNICFKVIFSFNNIYPIKMAYNGSITNKIEELIPLVRVTPKKKQILERVIPKNPINKR
ncbi:unnamed protein product [marine sediment metagenome]|uniref:Uncharacterized protein n=1 Tax=marine sediment metagenome TaxID=412755 RepID=X1S7T0_9ZZZZ